MTQEQIEAREREVAGQLDGHYCYDWDGLAVSAWTPEYDCCVCYKKSLRGRIANWLYMLWFNRQERKARRGKCLKPTTNHDTCYGPGTRCE